MTEGERFPRIEADSLSGKEVILPDDAEGRVVLVGVAFRREAQGQLDSWMEVFQDMCSGMDVYEVPMIENSFWKIFSGFIDGGMRAGIPEEKHDYVLTHYGNAEEVKRVLGIEDTSLGYVFLLDEDGDILFKGQGYIDEDGKEKMLKSVKGVCEV